MKLTKKYSKELYTKGKKKGLFTDLTYDEAIKLELPYLIKNVKINFSKDLNSKVIVQSVTDMISQGSSYPLNGYLNDSLSWFGEVSDLQLTQEGEALCDIVIMDHTMAVYLEEKKGYKLDVNIKPIGTDTQYFTIESFLLLKEESDEVAKVTADVISVEEEYVDKTEYDSLVCDFQELKKEALSAIEDLESKLLKTISKADNLRKERGTFIDKLNEANKQITNSLTIIKYKDESIATLETRSNKFEADVKIYKDKELNLLAEKKQAKFNEVFNVYCKAHNIPNTERESKRLELSSLNEQTLEMIHKDAKRLVGKFVQLETPIENSQNQITVAEIKPQDPKKIDYFEQIKKIRGNN